MLLLALLPPTWLAPWSADVGAIVSLPLRPIEWVLARVRTTLRPAPVPESGNDERWRELTEDRDHYRALWFAERQRVGELEQRLEAVEQVRRVDRSSSRPVAATVIGQTSAPGSDLLVIDAGSEVGVRVGDPVVTAGDRLVGRIAEQTSDRRAKVMAVNHPLNGRIDALVEQLNPGAGDDGVALHFVPIQLTPLRNGRLEGEVAVGSGVALGDIVRLADPAWKRSAQGLRIGIVRALEPMTRNPLRLRAEIEPELEPARAVSVVVKCEDLP